MPRRDDEEENDEEKDESDDYGEGYPYAAEGELDLDIEPNPFALETGWQGAEPAQVTPQREPGPGVEPHAPEPLGEFKARPDVAVTPPPSPKALQTEIEPGSIDYKMAGISPTPMRSAMDYAAQIQPPPFRPYPERPPIEPGFRGALKDFARGMIPGYIQGKEAAFKERVAEDAARRKYEMDVYKQQVGIMKPMLQKDYATQAWIQEVEMRLAYFNLRYPWMSQREKAARSTKTHYTPPTPPRPGQPKEAHFLPGVLPKELDPAGQNKLAVMWSPQAGDGTGGWVLPGGQEVPNQIMNQAVEWGTQAQQGPHYIENAVPSGAPEGAPPGVMVVPRPGAAAVQVPNVRKIPPPQDPLRQFLAQEAANRAKEAAERSQQRLTLAQQQALAGQQEKFDKNRVVERFVDLMPLMEVLKRDMGNPANHERLMYVFARINDPRTGVRETEREEIVKFQDTIIKKIGQQAYNAFIAPGGRLTPRAVEQLKAAIADYRMEQRQQYHSLRRQTFNQIEQTFGLAPDEIFLKDYAEPFETTGTDPRDPSVERVWDGEKWLYRNPSNKRWEPVR
jgi:hypothetical protein